jgi:hypothetical protein
MRVSSHTRMRMVLTLSMKSYELQLQNVPAVAEKVVVGVMGRVSAFVATLADDSKLSESLK